MSAVLWITYSAIKGKYITLPTIFGQHISQAQHRLRLLSYTLSQIIEAEIVVDGICYLHYYYKEMLTWTRDRERSNSSAPVYAACKDSPKDYRDICGEVKSLQRE